MLQNPAISRIYSSAVQGKKLGRALHGLIRLELSPCLCQVPPRLPCLSPLHDEVTAVLGLQMVKRSLSVGDLLTALWPEERSWPGAAAGQEPLCSQAYGNSSELTAECGHANGLCSPWLTPGLPCGHTCRMARVTMAFVFFPAPPSVTCSLPPPAGCRPLGAALSSFQGGHHRRT